MPDNLLVLHPADPEAAPPPAELLESLREVGLAADAFTFEGATHYRPGDRFLQLVTYLGCSPVVSLGAPGVTGDEFAHIAVEGPWERAHFLAGANAKPPRCPGCRQRLSAWSVAQVQEGPAERHTCAECGRETPYFGLDWRQSAGYARLFLKIYGVFEGEAVPSDRLLARLAGLGAGPWSYFWMRR